jgi:hypothetical protein
LNNIFIAVIIDPIVEVSAPQKNVMLKQVISLVVLSSEIQAFQDLIDILIPSLYLRLRGSQVSVNHGDLSLAYFDGAPDSALVASNSKDSSTDLCKLKL